MALILHPESERKRLAHDIVAALHKEFESAGLATCFPPREGPLYSGAATQDEKGTEAQVPILKKSPEDIVPDIVAFIRKSSDGELKSVEPALDKLLSEIDEKMRDMVECIVRTALKGADDRKTDEHSPDSANHPQSHSPSIQ